MKHSVVVVPAPGGKPRGFHLDDTIEREAALIETLRGQQRTGELHSITVTPFEPDPKADEVRAVARATARAKKTASKDAALPPA